MFDSKKIIAVTAMLAAATAAQAAGKAVLATPPVTADTVVHQAETVFGNAPGQAEPKQSIVPLPAGKSVSRGPAPGLTYLQISYVGSSNIGWEQTPDGLYTTVYDHGGTQLRVVTDELGYGNLMVARMNGSVLPSSAQYSNSTICWNGVSYVTPCSAGQTVAGWRRYWNLDGYQSGTFSYQNTSINSPFNTMSDWINIR